MKINSVSQELRNTAKRFDGWFDENMSKLDEPYIFFGDEPNSFKKEWVAPEDKFKIAIGSGSNFGMSRGIAIFYEQFNTVHPDWITERVSLHASARDRQILKEEGFSLLSTESHMPLKAYDVVAISNYVVCGYVDMIAYFIQSGIAPKWQDRKEDDPIFIHGGHVNMNVSIVKDICDIYIIGEGEEIDVAVLEEIEQGMRDGMSKEDILYSLACEWDCLWIPRFYEERYDDSGKLLGMFPIREGVPAKIKRAYVKDLDNMFIVSKEIVPYNTFEVGHECRIELSRGCDSKCAFCGPGYIYMPYRVRSAEVYNKAVDSWLYNCGLEREILTVGFSSAAHPQYYKILSDLKAKGYPVTEVPVRVSDYVKSPDRMSEIKEGRLVIGIEGNSQRLRDIVSKHATEEDIIKTVSLAMDRGCTDIKFYMIAELPTEQREDTLEILELGRKLRSLIDNKVAEGCKDVSLFFSWNLLRILPFTPFQWCRTSVKASDTLAYVIEELRKLGFSAKAYDRIDADNEYFYDALLTLADSRIQDLLIDIVSRDLLSLKGMPPGIMDVINEYFEGNEFIGWDSWFCEHEIDDVLPWDFIDNGVSRKYLERRYREILSGAFEQTPRCLDRCDNCGQCDEESLRQMSKWRAVRDKSLAAANNGGGNYTQTVSNNGDGRNKSLAATNNGGGRNKSLTAANNGDGNEASEIKNCSGRDKLRNILFIFNVERPHNLVDPLYWKCDFCRAMFRAGIKYNPASVYLSRSQFLKDDRSVGLYGMEVGIYSERGEHYAGGEHGVGGGHDADEYCERGEHEVDEYCERSEHCADDVSELIARINSEAAHFRIIDACDFGDNKPIVQSVVYRYPLTDKEYAAAADRIPEVMAAVSNDEEWVIPRRIAFNSKGNREIRQNVSGNIVNLRIDGGQLWLELKNDEHGYAAPSRAIICALTGHDPMANEEGPIFREALRI